AMQTQLLQPSLDDRLDLVRLSSMGLRERSKGCDLVPRARAIPNEVRSPKSLCPGAEQLGRARITIVHRDTEHGIRQRAQRGHRRRKLSTCDGMSSAQRECHQEPGTFVHCLAQIECR